MSSTTTYEARIKYDAGGAVFPCATREIAESTIQALRHLPAFRSGEIFEVTRTSLGTFFPRETPVRRR